MSVRDKDFGQAERGTICLRSQHQFVLQPLAPRSVNTLDRETQIVSPRVFISHSSEDKPIAETICRRFEADGIKCWIAPRDIEPVSDWTKAIMQGIETCQVFILIFSKQGNESDHVYREVAKAFSARLAVVPFRIEAGSPKPNLGYYPNPVQLLHPTDPPFERNFSCL